MQLGDDVPWVSYENYLERTQVENVNHRNSSFSINEVIALDTATFLKASLSCHLYNQFGESLRLESGDLTFRLK